MLNGVQAVFEPYLVAHMDHGSNIEAYARTNCLEYSHYDITQNAGNLYDMSQLFFRLGNGVRNLPLRTSPNSVRDRLELGCWNSAGSHG